MFSVAVCATKRTVALTLTSPLGGLFRKSANVERFAMNNNEDIENMVQNVEWRL